MSIGLMSAVFVANIPDIEIDCGSEKHTVKASTSKFVLLALADHANDEGKGAYPSIETIGKKTSLQRRTVQRALDALIKNGYIICVGSSEYGTDNYTIIKNNIPKGDDSRAGGDLRAEIDDSRAEKHAPESPESSLNHTKPLKKGDMLDGLLFYEKQALEQQIDVIEDVLNLLEKGLRRNIPRQPDWQSLAKWIIKQDNVNEWVSWYMNDEFRATNSWRLNPQQIRNSWPQAPKKYVPEVRKVAPPKEPEVYLTGEELSARLRGEK